MNKKIWISASFFLVLGIFLALPVLAQQTAPAGSAGADLKVSPEVRAMASNPAPPANAQQMGSVGSDNATMKTKNSSGDSGDSMWVQEIDVDGDGNVEKASLLWDDEDKVLFIAYKDDFACKKGGTGSGAVLIGLNGTGNARNAPAGSGFYTVSLDKTECGSETAGLWGCKFDENGVETACGLAVLDEKNDTLIIATATQ